MIYLIAASVPAEVQYSIPADKTHALMLHDILCSRWTSAFQRAKKLGMPVEFQSQLYINAKYHFKSVQQCPAIIPRPINSDSNSVIQKNMTGSYIPSSSSIWGGVFK